ncbi:glycoside hydrolase family 28 protein [Niabella terrae]
MLTYSLKGAVPIEQVQVSTPFGTVTISKPVFEACPRFDIRDFGARPNDKEKTTAAIQQAIQAAHEKGGGIVVIPRGTWLTKGIRLASQVNLELQEGSVLLFSENPADYLPAVHTSWEGLECYNYAPLIYAYECQDIAITGSGKIQAKMDVWKQWFSRPPAHMNSIKWLYNQAQDRVPADQRYMVNDTAHLRPQLIQFNRSSRIRLENFQIENSPFWTVHLYLSRDIIVRGLNIYAHGHNNDGIDPEMSQQVLIEDCRFDQGDDAIAIKSGRNPEGWRLKTPSRNIIIRNCFVKNGHQLVAIGSELSGGIENVYVENCKVARDNRELMHLLFIKTNERMGGYVKNIFFKNVEAGHLKEGILGIDMDVLYQWRYLVPTRIKKLTPISDIYLEQVQAETGQFVSRIKGNPDQWVEHVSLKNTGLDTALASPHQHQYLKGFSLIPAGTGM